MRQVVLDTETTGLEASRGHRIIEIGCVELINRKFTGRTYHQYINPEREIDAEAEEVHGISLDFLSDKPVFAKVAQEFFDFIRGSQLVIHNAPFDVGFMDHEFKWLDEATGSTYGKTEDHCQILDTLVMSRQMHPGSRHSLDALCKKYDIDNSHRELHGALLDAEILADVYLRMTGGQTDLKLVAESEENGNDHSDVTAIHRLNPNRNPLPVITASDDELLAHQEKISSIDGLWDRLS
ncbi:DNA polymerase III subunit epsilon [Oceanospirillum linum]|uniref:DNA polymerase III subunit epsilon n=1 Tax=Oceanospirillum linum TaxID=966 RepID=A0A1T1HCP0_OCELI|nr:DNA polymerase III subunit epsilon [Oceanospirillum linum]OOV87638.1 DNA polymerase III subunit epsilon [Oceanospirillum linum]SEF94720.1 DNA polymerase-3 subunit epsilon [Oleiphilus messinensis]SMP11804.1 DNA polymerase-3 subunit epsilon [Oceanospirillum linum]